jgi:DNA-binding response OmpR family regulator
VTVRIVVADDSETIRALVATIIGKEGFETATASDGVEALALIREHRPELLIVDAVMPRMSGYDLCSALHADADGPHPHVIMLTGAGEGAGRRRALEAGVNEVVAKPFSPARLRARVREILGDG